MAKKAFVVTGLGYGDEGKGTTTHWLSSQYKSHTVIRTGGPQALHHVVCKNGAEHVFSQFGSGTLRGSATHLSKHMVIDPNGILKEGTALKYEQGISNVLSMMTIHEDALVITPFQAIAGRLREIMRGKNRHGSVGIGVGETVLDAETFSNEAILAKDLADPGLREKLEAIRQRKLKEFEELRDRASFIPQKVPEEMRLEIADLENPNIIQWTIERFAELVKHVRIVDTEYVTKHILGAEGVVVFEGSQGVLLDRWHGFHPYTTKVRTVPRMALEILNDCGYTGEVKSLGVLRAYHTRHGAGPFVTESSSLTEKMPDPMNKKHRWQGNFRVGHFDVVAARYAIQACSEGSIDGLVITCLDRIWPFETWQVCNTYHTTANMLDGESFFRFDGSNISSIVTHGGESGSKQLQRQEGLGKLLGECSPILTEFHIAPRGAKKRFIDLCKKNLKATLGIPVFAISIGPTEEDKIVL